MGDISRKMAAAVSFGAGSVRESASVSCHCVRAQKQKRVGVRRSVWRRAHCVQVVGSRECKCCARCEENVPIKIGSTFLRPPGPSLSVECALCSRPTESISGKQPGLTCVTLHGARVGELTLQDGARPSLEKQHRRNLPSPSANEKRMTAHKKKKEGRLRRAGVCALHQVTRGAPGRFQGCVEKKGKLRRCEGKGSGG